jgi:hypothetical protein
LGILPGDEKSSSQMKLKHLTFDDKIALAINQEDFIRRFISELTNDMKSKNI